MANAPQPGGGTTAAAAPGCRPDLTITDTAAPDYRQEGIIPLLSETHSGEDVPIYATGARAAIVHGTASKA